MSGGSDASRLRKHSLYARSAVFVLVGCGTLVGAIFVFSRWIIHDAEDRLLAERMTLARTTGGFLDHRIHSHLSRLIDAALARFDPDPSNWAAGEAAIAREARQSVFSEGVFVLDAHGAPVLTAPLDAWLVREAAEGALVRGMMDRARARGVAVSPLLRLAERPVVILLAPIPGDRRPRGYLGAVLAPGSNNLLQAARSNAHSEGTELALVDKEGVVIASTQLQSLFNRREHKGVLGKAIEARTEFRGRCHRCHEEESGRTREMNVAAFAPLPTLDLGLLVLEPEATALAPALAVRRQLWLGGASLILLFVGFAVLSVRSVVRPIARLTEAVRRTKESTAAIEPTAYGDDEIGELASALATWREKMTASLRLAEESREALRQETDAIRRHLEALSKISEVSTFQQDMQALVDGTLDRTLELSRRATGVLRLSHREEHFTAIRGLSPEAAAALLTEGEAQLASATRLEGEEGPAERLVAISDASSPPDSTSRRSGMQGGGLLSSHGLRILLMLTSNGAEVEATPLWLGSLLRHLSLCASHQLLRGADRERQRQHERFITAVLKAQEDERTRVAHELHDTVAQEIAALRLEIERLGGHASDQAQRQQLLRLEAQAKDLLETVRRILLDLRLPVLEAMGFVPALHWLVERAQREYGLDARLAVEGDESQLLDYEENVSIFRILQEGLLNVVQHADAAHAFATLTLGSDSVQLTLEDDGKGFDPESLKQRGPGRDGHGLGVLGMEERALLLGGTFHITSSPGEGTTIEVSVPVSRQSASAVGGA